MSMDELKSSIENWELFEYFTVAMVILGVIGEYIHSFVKGWPKTELWKHRLGNGSVLLLIAGLALELVALVKVNDLSGQVIAVLEVGAERLKSDNLKLEAQIQPRRLDESQQKAIADALVLFAGKRVDIVSYGLDGEALLLGKQIFEALKAAWIRPIDRTSTQLAAGQIISGVQVSGSDQMLASAIRDALEKFGHLKEGPTYSTGVGNVVISSGSMMGAGVEATIFVGIKPLPP